LKSDPSYEIDNDIEWLQLLAVNSNEPAEEVVVKRSFTGFFFSLTVFIVMLSMVIICFLCRCCWRVKAKQSIISRGKKKTVGGIKKSLMYVLKHNDRLQSIGGYNL